MPEKLVYQERFISIIKDMAPANISLANEMSSVLEISLDSAYRRLRCETDLTLNEVVKLCYHFDVPLEALNNEIPSVVTFKFSRFLQDKETFHQYLQSILADLQWLQKFEKKQVYFAAEDVPVFHHFGYHELSCFKLFYWMKSILGLENFQTLNFSAETIDKDMLDTCNGIFRAYAQIPAVEVWTEETLLSTLRQIRFYWDAGFFHEAQTAITIADQLLLTVQHLQRQAETGKKFTLEGTMTAHDFTFYLSDLMIGNNCVVVKADDKQSTYISYNSFNSMRTSNKFFNEQSERWMNNLIGKSTLLSGVAEKYRNQFFKGLYKRIDDLKQYILNN